MDITARLSEDVVPMYEYVLTHVDLDPASRGFVRAALLKAGFAGVRVGVNEVQAQLIEQGEDVDFSIGVPDPTWEQLLADEA